jgi:hypothetical protein
MTQLAIFTYMGVWRTLLSRQPPMYPTRGKSRTDCDRWMNESAQRIPDCPTHTTTPMLANRGPDAAKLG